jgi:serine/threonine protein kinase
MFVLSVLFKALKDHITLSNERNRMLALLSRITSSTRIFPQRHELKGIKYCPLPIAEGGFGKVHQGLSDPNICIKVTTRVDPTALTVFFLSILHAIFRIYMIWQCLQGYVRELIVWSHSSHPNVLPFYGVFLDEAQQICLVSPFMKNGNLQDYAPRLPQKSRVPFVRSLISLVAPDCLYIHYE